MKFFRNSVLVIGIVLCAALVLAVAIGAQEKKPAGSSKKEEVIITHGPKGAKYRLDGKGENLVQTLIGDVIIKHLDTTITAEKVVYTQKTKTAVAEGNVKIVDPEAVITGSKVTAILPEHNIVIEGPVKLVSTPKSQNTGGDPDSPKAKMREPSTITCDKLQYQYRTKVASAEGNMKVVQKDRTLVGQKGVYDTKQELVTLTGGARVTDNEGQSFSSPGTVKASLKDGSEWLETENANAVLKVDIDAETGDDAKDQPSGKENPKAPEQSSDKKK